jgi:hypothetical protein
MDEYLGQLGQAHGFTLEELRANQAGVLHPAQLARGRRQGRFGIAVFVALGVLALVAGMGGAWLYLDSFHLYPPTRTDYNAMVAIAGAGDLVALAFFVAAWRSGRRRRARLAAFEQGRIDVVEGPLDKVHVGGSQGYTTFRVRDRRFGASRRLFELLTQGAAYRLYLVDDQLLSLAPAGDDPNQRDEYERELAKFVASLQVPPSKSVT